MRLAAAFLAVSLVPAAAQAPRLVEEVGANIRLSIPDSLPTSERQNVIGAAVALYRNNVCNKPGRAGDFDRFGSGMSSVLGSNPDLPYQQAVIRIVAILVAAGDSRAVCEIIEQL